MPLTQNEHNVLSLLQQKGALHGRDFAEIATVQNGRWEWANPILRRMAEKNLVERGNVKTYKGFDWTITEAGRAALLEPVEEKTLASTALSLTMQNQLLWIGRHHRRNEVCETTLNRTTHKALKARGLVEIEIDQQGWQQLILTEAGAAKFNELCPAEAFTK